MDDSDEEGLYPGDADGSETSSGLEPYEDEDDVLSALSGPFASGALPSSGSQAAPGDGSSKPISSAPQASLPKPFHTPSGVPKLRRRSNAISIQNARRSDSLNTSGTSHGKVEPTIPISEAEALQPGVSPAPTSPQGTGTKSDGPSVDQMWAGMQSLDDTLPLRLKTAVKKRVVNAVGRGKPEARTKLSSIPEEESVKSNSAAGGASASAGAPSEEEESASKDSGETFIAVGSSQDGHRGWRRGVPDLAHSLTDRMKGKMAKRS